MGYLELHLSWRFLVDWTGRMAQRFGGTVYDREDSAKVWDWGQALTRELYGLNWMNNPNYKKESNIEPDQPCNPETIQKAKDWEDGNWPHWAWTTKYPNPQEQQDEG